jgi:hypothetical protein
MGLCLGSGSSQDRQPHDGAYSVDLTHADTDILFSILKKECLASDGKTTDTLIKERLVKGEIWRRQR